MSEKKCRMCGDDAKWELDSECYCEFCARTELDVHAFVMPRRCEMCGNTLDRVYYTDGECNAFCSAKCALEYNDACEIENSGEEQDGDDGDDGQL